MIFELYELSIVMRSSHSYRHARDPSANAAAYRPSTICLSPWQQGQCSGIIIMNKIGRIDGKEELIVLVSLSRHVRILEYLFDIVAVVVVIIAIAEKKKSKRCRIMRIYILNRSII